MDDPDMPARRRRGRTQAAVERTLAAWRAGGHLAGDEHAAVRRVLAGLAESVDGADRDYNRGGLSAFSRARVHGTLLQALLLVGPDDVASTDLDEALARLLDEADQV